MEVKGNIGEIEPAQIDETVLNIGVEVGLIVTVIVLFEEHCPLVGVKT